MQPVGESQLGTIDGINLLRGIAIIGVLLIHTTGPILSSVPDGQSPHLLVLVLNQLSRFSVPAFLFISGYLYGRKYFAAPLDVKKFLTSRIHNILIPYLVWSAIYILMRILINKGEVNAISPLNVAQMLLRGAASGHLYFIPLIFQFYLLFPILINFVRRNSHNMGFIVASVSVLGFILVALNSYLPLQILSCVGLEYTNYLLLWWLPYAFLGIYIGSKEVSLAVNCNYLMIFALTTVAALLMIVECIYFAHSSGIQSSTWFIERHALNSVFYMTFLRPTAFLYGMLAVVLMYRICERCDCGQQPAKLLRKIGVCSSGIYFAHPLVMTFLSFFMKKAGFNVYSDLNTNLIYFLLLLLISYCAVAGTRGLGIATLVWGPHRQSA